MICPACHGLLGEFIDLPDGRGRLWRPCSVCTGGIASCCDGAVGLAEDVTNTIGNENAPGD